MMTFSTCRTYISPNQEFWCKIISQDDFQFIWHAFTILSIENSSLTMAITMIEHCFIYIYCTVTTFVFISLQKVSTRAAKTSGCIFLTFTSLLKRCLSNHLNYLPFHVLVFFSRSFQLICLYR